MTSGAVARWSVAVTISVVAALAALHPAPATAHPECDLDNDVRLVVDNGPLRGGVNVQCVEDAADLTVAEVMAAAGVEVTWVQRYPGAFVCRLDGRPADLPCADTPPADRFWGLFWAAVDDRSWTYATEGAGSLQVPGGGTVGWRFQDGGGREEPAHVLKALPGATGLGTGEKDPPQTTPPGGQASEGGGPGSTTLAGLLLITALCVAGFVVVRRRP